MRQRCIDRFDRMVHSLVQDLAQMVHQLVHHLAVFSYVGSP